MRLERMHSISIFWTFMMNLRQIWKICMDSSSSANCSNFMTMTVVSDCYWTSNHCSIILSQLGTSMRKLWHSNMLQPSSLISVACVYIHAWNIHTLSIILQSKELKFNDIQGVDGLHSPYTVHNCHSDPILRKAPSNSKMQTTALSSTRCQDEYTYALEWLGSWTHCHRW